MPTTHRSTRNTEANTSRPPTNPPASGNRRKAAKPIHQKQNDINSTLPEKVRSIENADTRVIEEQEPTADDGERLILTIPQADGSKSLSNEEISEDSISDSSLSEPPEDIEDQILESIDPELLSYIPQVNLTGPLPSDNNRGHKRGASSTILDRDSIVDGRSTRSKPNELTQSEVSEAATARRESSENPQSTMLPSNSEPIPILNLTSERVLPQTPTVIRNTPSLASSPCPGQHSNASERVLLQTPTAIRNMPSLASSPCPGQPSNTPISQPISSPFPQSSPPTHDSTILTASDVGHSTGRRRSKKETLSATELKWLNLHQDTLFVWWFEGKIWADSNDIETYVQRLMLANGGQPSSYLIDACRREVENSRSHVMEAANRIVSDAYGLGNLTVETRSGLIKTLLSPSHPLFLCAPNTKSLFTHPAISTVLIRLYWNSHKGKGVSIKNLVNLLNPVILSWSATCLWVALKRWEDGILNKLITIKTANARDIFDKYYASFKGRSADKLVEYHRRLILPHYESYTKQVQGVQPPKGYIPIDQEEEAGLDALLGQV